jgi:Protein of unknown function (DUF3298)
MKGTRFILLLLVCSSIQAQTEFYKVYTGNLMGAEAVAHLHVSKGNISGYLYLVKDPRPFTIYTESSTWKKDSVMIYSSRSHQVSINITGVINQQQIQGNAIMYQDDKELRKGAILFKETVEPYSAFSYVSTSGRASLPANLKNESTASYAASSIWPMAADKSPIAANIRKIFYTSFQQAPPKEPAVLLPADQQKSLAGWKNGYIKAGVKETENMGQSLSEESDRKLLVMSESKSFITISFYGFSISGGAAHGGWSTDLYSFDKRNSKQLQLSDVVTPAGISALPGLLSKAARAQFKVPANQGLEQAGLTKNIIPVTKNFWVDNAGLGFWYQPYEIGPFSYGDIVLFVPLSQLTNYIQPSFLKQ